MKFKFENLTGNEIKKLFRRGENLNLKLIYGFSILQLINGILRDKKIIKLLK